jgi:hypothetical protein
MRTVLIAIVFSLLATHGPVAQQAPRSPGPTNPNSTQHGPIEGTKTGSRGLTGNDEIPAPNTADPASPEGQHVEPNMKPMPSGKIK